MLQRKTFNDRADWLRGRTSSIGASEAAAVVGMSPFDSMYDLWARKTGNAPEKDLSGNPVIEYGNRLEPAMRVMFQAEHPELKLEYHQFDVLHQEGRPWMTATLDGELTDAQGRKGILEIKTASVGKKAQWDKWNDAIPLNYRAQICHQLLVTGWDFAVLYAKLLKLNGDSELRTYWFEREEMKEEMDWLLEQETSFWNKFVATRTAPPVTLPAL